MILKSILSNKLIKIIFSVCFCFIAFNGVTSVKADDAVTSLEHPHKPSGPGINLPGWVARSSYKLQPQPSYSQSVDNTVTISTELYKNNASNLYQLFTDLIGSIDFIKLITQITRTGYHGAQYYWYVQAPNQTGLKLLPNKNPYYKKAPTNRPSLTLSSHTPGTFLVQASAQVIPSGNVPFFQIFNPLLFSSPTTVTFLPKAVPSDSITISTDSNYLISNRDIDEQTTYAHFKAHPEDATDTKDLTWYTSDSTLPNSPASKFISINPNTGEIKVNQENETAIAYVGAKLNNLKIKPVPITIGKMLTINENKSSFSPGDKPDLELHGDYTGAQSITWKKVVGNHSPINIDPPSDGHILHLNLSNADDNTRYFVTVTFITGNKHGKDITKTITSNPIDINVGDSSPIFHTEHFIQDKNYQATADKSSLKIMAGDNIVHTIDVSYDAPDPKHPMYNSGTLTFPLSVNETLASNAVSINGTTVDKPEITTLDNNEKILTIKNIKLAASKSTIIIKTVVNSNLTPEKINYDPALATSPISGNGNEYNIHIDQTFGSFIKGGITLNPSDIDFGDITIPKFTSSINTRVSPDDDDYIITVEDERRKKSPVTLSLNFSGKFKKWIDDKSYVDDTTYSKNMKLKYFDAQNHEVATKNNIVQIEKSSQNESLDSIQWGMNEGLRLYIKNANFSSGTYESTISWSFCESI